MIEATPRGGITSVDGIPAPIESDSGKISTRDEAEIKVRKLRNVFWAEMRPGDRRVANARARMAIADEAFALLAREDLTPMEIRRSTFLLIDARDRLIQSSEGHFGRAADIWADGMSQVIREYKIARQQAVAS